MNLYTEEGIEKAIKIARSACNATMRAMLSAESTAEEVTEKMAALTMVNDLFINTFKSVLYEG